MAEVAPRGRRTLELDASLLPLAHFPARRIDDSDRVSGERAAARDQFQGVGPIVTGRQCLPALGQAQTVDPVERRHPAERREGQADAAFGEPVDGCHGLGAKAARAETRLEAPQRARAHRLRAVGDHPDAGEVETLDRLVGDPGRADFEGEVGRSRQRSPTMMHGPQPILGVGEEALRRQEQQRRAVIECPEPGADQPHVVVERQPAHEHVPGRGSHRRAHGADVGQQVGVAQHHALGIARAARRVLQQRQLVGGPRREAGRTFDPHQQRRNLADAAQALDQWPHQPPRRSQFRREEKEGDPASRRIPRCRSRCSSSWAGRAGG